jgi:hypothetical protein
MEHRMTVLEQLIRHQVATSVATTVSRATDQIAEEMAREILKDPQFRADLQQLIKRAFTQTLTDFAAEAQASD